MYWIYLIIFILAILTPQMVSQHFPYLKEDDVESIVIFFFGALGFFIYIAKEKALLRVFKEKLHLQKQTNIITKDLSESYSYIGEMNRKFDIVKDLIFGLPRESAESFAEKNSKAYEPILEAARLLSKSDVVSLRFVNTKTKELTKVEEDRHEEFALFSGERLVAPRKAFWEEDGYVIARAPRSACEASAFLIFPKSANHSEDIDIFQILASEALFLFCAEKNLAASLLKESAKKDAV
ncbi:MAG: hypothetical protein AAB519_01345 [Patescibacteria group bacterium]